MKHLLLIACALGFGLTPFCPAFAHSAQNQEIRPMMASVDAAHSSLHEVPSCCIGQSHSPEHSEEQTVPQTTQIEHPSDAIIAKYFRSDSTKILRGRRQHRAYFTNRPFEQRSANKRE
ncbi:MAG: hypothetical protein AAB386_01200 [Patescibacteria group bacterium]